MLAIAASLIAASMLVDRVPQDLGYHLFADRRTLLGIPNFWNVVTNLPFTIFGALGLWKLRSYDKQVISEQIRPAYYLFFLGLLVTGIGSSWYHLFPDNASLVRDRLPMTVAFMALFTIVIGEYVCAQSARRLLWPLLLVGATSVLYWQLTEAHGIGDLRPYALVQFLPIVMIPIILLTYRSAFGGTAIYWGMLFLYAISKLLEKNDNELFQLFGQLSGHSIKHLVAGAAGWLFLYGLARRARGENLRTVVPRSQVQ